MTEILFSGNVSALRSSLSANPSLVHEPVSLPGNSATAVPLHRLCDAVFMQAIPASTAIEMANIFFESGANPNEIAPGSKDSPLIAAASLHCDLLALLYLEHGARIDHRGTHGGTVLHWSSWCGRDEVVKHVLTMNPNVNERCDDFKATPLFWAVNGYKQGGAANAHQQVECVSMLIAHGADPDIPNYEGRKAIQLLDESDTRLRALLS